MKTILGETNFKDYINSLYKESMQLQNVTDKFSYEDQKESLLIPKIAHAINNENIALLKDAINQSIFSISILNNEQLNINKHINFDAIIPFLLIINNKSFNTKFIEDEHIFLINEKTNMSSKELLDDILLLCDKTNKEGDNPYTSNFTYNDPFLKEIILQAYYCEQNHYIHKLLDYTSLQQFLQETRTESYSTQIFNQYKEDFKQTANDLKNLLSYKIKKVEHDYALLRSLIKENIYA